MVGSTRGFMQFRPLLVACIVLIACGSARADDAKKPINLVHNGGFEEDGQWPFIPSGANASGGTVDDVAHSGKRSYRMTNKSGFAPNVYARIVQVQSGLK